MSSCSVEKIVEIPVLIIFITFMLTGPIGGNLIIYRTCYNILNYNQTECALLGKQSNNPDIMKLEKLVEPTSMMIQMTLNLIQTIISSLICLFVGPWTDRFGRKPILISPLIGLCFSYLLNAIFCFFPNISPWYFIICSIPSFLSGGIRSYFIVVFAYITDTTSEDNRGLRMGTFQAAMTMGSIAGSLFSSYFFYSTSYTVVYLTSAILIVLALFYTIYFIPESLEGRERDGWIKGFFELSNLKQMVITTFKQRPNYDRCIIFTGAIVLIIATTTTLGSGSVIFMYLRAQFGWTLEKYTYFNCVTSVLSIVGNTVCICILSKALKIPESMLILFGCISSIVGELLLGFARSDWWLYASGSTILLSTMLGPMVTTLISRTIPSADCGKIFSFFIICELIFSIPGSTIYTAIYNATLLTYPGTFALFTAGCYVVIALLIILIMVLHWRNRLNYNTLIDENQEISENNADN